jgi:hypothetical protein
VGLLVEQVCLTTTEGHRVRDEDENSPGFEREGDYSAVRQEGACGDWSVLSTSYFDFLSGRHWPLRDELESSARTGCGNHLGGRIIGDWVVGEKQFTACARPAIKGHVKHT